MNTNAAIIASALGWSDNDTTHDISDVQLSSGRYISVADGVYWYLVDEEEAVVWAANFVPGGGMRPYDGFCDRVAVLDPTVVLTPEELSDSEWDGLCGVDGDPDKRVSVTVNPYHQSSQTSASHNWGVTLDGAISCTFDSRARARRYAGWLRKNHDVIESDGVVRVIDRRPRSTDAAV